MNYLLMHTYPSGMNFYAIECDFPLGEMLHDAARRRVSMHPVVAQLAELWAIGFFPNEGEDLIFMEAPLPRTLTRAQFEAILSKSIPDDTNGER